MPEVGIVVPTLKNFKGLAECILSIQSRFSYKVFIQPAWKTNNCVAKSWNEGFKQACNYNKILIINDDILFSSQCIEELVSGLDRHQDIDMLTGWSTGEPESIFDFHYEEEQLLEGPDFACFMIRADFQRKYGSFDENFKPAYFEDNDMHYRMRLLGGKAMKTTLAPFYHHGSVTQNMDKIPSCLPDQFITNRSYYVEKWGGEPDSEEFIYPYNNSSLSPRDWYTYDSIGIENLIEGEVS